MIRQSLAEIAAMLVGLSNIPVVIVNPNDGTVRAAVVLGVADRILGLVIPQPTEWQHIGN